jgi:hypothetical protein
MKRLFVLLAVSLPLLVLAKEKKPPPAPPPAPAPAAAKPTLSPEQQKYLDERASLISKTFQFNATQSAKFWPVYQQYQDGFLALGPPIERPANPDALDDAAAAKVASAFLDRDAKVTALRTKFFPEFEKALGGKQAARFIALDRRLWAEALAKAAAVPAAAPAPAQASMVAPPAAAGAVQAAAPMAAPMAAPAVAPAAAPASTPSAPPEPPTAAPASAPPVAPAPPAPPTPATK